MNNRHIEKFERDFYSLYITLQNDMYKFFSFVVLSDIYCLKHQQLRNLNNQFYTLYNSDIKKSSAPFFRSRRVLPKNVYFRAKSLIIMVDTTLLPYFQNFPKG